MYPRRSVESQPPLPYQFLLAGDRVQRIYLDELGQTNQSLGVGIVQLVVQSEKVAAAKAKELIAKAKQELLDAQTQQQIIEFIETIVIYKFPSLSRQEVETMLGLDLIRNTRVYQEAFTEGERQGRQEGERQGRQEGERQGRQEGERQGRQEGERQGRQEGERQGRQEGERQGRQEGERQGRQAAKLETVPSLIELGLSIEQIAQVLAIDVELVRQAASKQP